MIELHYSACLQAVLMEHDDTSVVILDVDIKASSGVEALLNRIDQMDNAGSFGCQKVRFSKELWAEVLSTGNVITPPELERVRHSFRNALQKSGRIL